MSHVPDVSPGPPVAVVCALICREDLVLLARRAPGKRLGGLWEFPGGKIDPGESAVAALHRELQEELGCVVEILRTLPGVSHDYPWGRIVMTPFVCRLRPGSPDPQPLDHSELAWVSPQEMRGFDLAPADLPVLDSFRA